MIPLGYMLKRITAPPDWLQLDNVVDVYSVASCRSNNFADYIHFWRHNGWWFFNSPTELEDLARENEIDLDDLTLFYYEAYEFEFDMDQGGIGAWATFPCDPSFKTDVLIPTEKISEGYDVVDYVLRNCPEDSLAACTIDVATACKLNKHCLFDSFEEAKNTLESGLFNAHEPGPFRIIAVYSLAARK